MENTPELIQCPKCSENVAEHNLKRHLKRVLSPEAERERVKKRADLAVAKAAELRAKREAELLLPCPICKTSVKKKNLAKHARIKHGLMLTSAQAKGEPEPNSRFRSAREREAFFRARLGPQLEEESHDAFERGRIVYGGAFELGKSRKH